MTINDITRADGKLRWAALNGSESDLAEAALEFAAVSDETPQGAVLSITGVNDAKAWLVRMAEKYRVGMGRRDDRETLRWAAIRFAQLTKRFERLAQSA